MPPEFRPVSGRDSCRIDGNRHFGDVDGARIIFPNGWGLVRASNTQDVLVMRFEADTQANLNSIRSQVEERVHLAKATL